MAMYRVFNKVTEFYYTDIEAENEDEAKKISEDMSGANFKPVDGSIEWEFDGIEEVE